jgi:hypothetical protein
VSYETQSFFFVLDLKAVGGLPCERNTAVYCYGTLPSLSIEFNGVSIKKDVTLYVFIHAPEQRNF